LDGLQGLNMRGFIEMWMKTYDHSTVLALEYYPFFCHMIFSAMLNAHINAEYVIEPLVSKEVGNIYTEISRLIR